MTVENSQKHSEGEKNRRADRNDCLSESVNKERRSVVRHLTVGTAALAGYSLLPAKWTAPLVEFGALPAHAVTSSTLEALYEELKNELAPEQEKKEEASEKQQEEQESGSGDGQYSKSEVIKKSGDIMIDRVLRSKFVSNRLGPAYGKSIKIVFNTGEVLYVPDTRHNVDTVEGRGYRPGGNYARNRDVHTMEVYADPGSRATSITVYYNG